MQDRLRSRLPHLLRQGRRAPCDSHWRRHKETATTGHRDGAGMLGRVQTEKKTGDSIMPLTHDFKETIRARAQVDPDFRQALLREAVDDVINGDLETGKPVLAAYLTTTVTH